MNHNNLPTNNPEQQKGTEELKLVPVERAVIGIATNPREESTYSKGAKEFNINNGIVQISDGEPGRGSVALAEDDLIKTLKEQGYHRNGNGLVAVGNGMHPTEMSDIMPRLAIDRAARQSGAQMRESTYIDNDGTEQTFVTANPFDDGDFIGINRETDEINANGEPVLHKDLPRDLIEDDPYFTDTIGKYNVNEGVISWVTPQGKVQISKATDERIQRLEAMGYGQKSDMNVPHSNGEQWNTDGYQARVINKVTGKPLGTVSEIWDRIPSSE